MTIKNCFGVATSYAFFVAINDSTAPFS